MDVQIWVDFHCPYCMIGKRRLLRALEMLGIADAHISLRSFFLNPDRDKPDGLPMADYIQAHYGGEPADIQQAFLALDKLARAEGFDMHMDRTMYGHTMDAHRLLQAAKAQGLGQAFYDTAQQALFVQGKLLSDRQTLLDLAEQVGLSNAQQVLDSDQFEQEVLEDDGQARQMKIDFVPYYVVDGVHHFSGDIQLPDYLQLLRAIEESREN